VGLEENEAYLQIILNSEASVALFVHVFEKIIDFPSAMWKIQTSHIQESN
jgi:hypothetical protein